MTASAAYVDDCGVYEQAPDAFSSQQLAAKPYRGAGVTQYLLFAASPRCIAEAKPKLDELGLLKPDWDSYGAPAISSSARNAALRLLEELVLPSTPTPAVIPTSDGSVQLEWHTKGIDLEVRVLSPARIGVFLEDGRNELQPMDKELQSDLRELQRAMFTLTSR